MTQLAYISEDTYLKHLIVVYLNLDETKLEDAIRQYEDLTHKLSDGQGVIFISSKEPRVEVIHFEK